jgi:hypothetical protein
VLQHVHRVVGEFLAVLQGETRAQLTAGGRSVLNYCVDCQTMRSEFPSWLPANYFPVMLFLYLLAKAFLPWRWGELNHHCYFSSWHRCWVDRGVLLALRSQCNILSLMPIVWQVIISPFGVVTFLSAYVGDVLTSTVKVDVSLAAQFLCVFTHTCPLVWHRPQQSQPMIDIAYTMCWIGSGENPVCFQAWLPTCFLALFRRPVAHSHVRR